MGWYRYVYQTFTQFEVLSLCLFIECIWSLFVLLCRIIYFLWLIHFWLIVCLFFILFFSIFCFHFTLCYFHSSFICFLIFIVFLCGNFFKDNLIDIWSYEMMKLWNNLFCFIYFSFRVQEKSEKAQRSQSMPSAVANIRLSWVII